MPSWPDTVKSALKELGGEATLVPGAKLKQRIVHFSEGASVTFDDFLATQGYKFSDWLSTLNGIVVYRRVGTDMLVGFPGAAWPQQKTKGRAATGRPQLRNDVYTALTQVNPEGYFYSPATDTFVAGPANDSNAVPLPVVTLADLIDERRAFVAEVEDTDAGHALQQALDFSGNPLGAFQRVVIERQLSLQWHTFKFDRLLSTLERWAGDNAMEIHPEWYDAPLDSGQGSPQLVLAKLATYMSDEEIRNLLVPFRAVEQWHRSEQRRRSRSS